MKRLRPLIEKRYPEVKWEKLDRHGEIVLEMFRAPGAKYLVRAGDGELFTLQHRRSKWIAPQLADAIRDADCLGLPGIAPPSEQTEAIINALRDHYQMEIDHAVHVSAYLFTYDLELIGQLVAGKRIVWITADADVIVNNLKNPAFRDYYGLHDIAGNVGINAAPGVEHRALPQFVSPEQSFADIQQQLARTGDFDLALVGAGTVGKPVCHHIKTALGKAAIDIGVAMSPLRGARDRRELKPGAPMDFLVWDPQINADFCGAAPSAGSGQAQTADQPDPTDPVAHNYLSTPLDRQNPSIAMSEEGSFETKYVCKHGMIYACDVYPGTFKSDRKYILPGEYSAIKNNDTVYVITNALTAWFDTVYPELKKRKIQIFLVTGDSTKSAPLGAFDDKDAFHKLMDEEIILHWFCQNCDYPQHTAVTPIPIGIDYHSQHREAKWGEPQTHYAAQDTHLDSYGPRTPEAWAAKKNAALLDAHLSAYMNPEHRGRAYHLFKDKDFTTLMPERLKRTEYWNLIHQHRFVFSPPGAGIDCHRTWEAIIIGSVPVILRSTIAELFEDLPVIMLDDYKEFTQDMMDAYAYPQKIDESRLLLVYWNNVIQETRRRIINN